MKILSTEIIDNTVTEKRQISETEFEEFIRPSGISVLVEIEFEGKNYHLDFQSTTTHDYDHDAYSSFLAAYDGTDEYDSLSEAVDDDEKFAELLDQIKTESDAQKIRDEYVEENFNVDDGYFGGMDANSEINKAVKK